MNVPDGCYSRKSIVHTEFDIYIYLFMLSGSLAFRHNEVGSWFLNAIVWTFKYHAHEEDILQLLSRVGLNEFLIEHFKTPKVFKFQLTGIM